MDIDHVHFYVNNADVWRDWFVEVFGFQSIATAVTRHTQTEVIRRGAVYFLLSSPSSGHSPIAGYLQQHPEGVADLAFRVTSVEAALDRAIAAGAQILEPIQVTDQGQGAFKWAQIRGWGDLKHTLLERIGESKALSQTPGRLDDSVSSFLIGRIRSDEVGEVKISRHATGSRDTAAFTGIDHAVLNVAAGDLEQAIAWYEGVLGFERQQTFAIQTEYSGLCSQVLVHPAGTAQLPINEPASTRSQIQEFLDVNRGSGIQHIALKTVDVVKTIAELRQRGVSFLRVPSVYYDQLRQRPGFQLSEAQWQAIAQQEVLVDWQDGNSNAMLLQVFTQPIFQQPTFFFELIERQTYRVEQQDKQAEGFGEGNFRALFEAIEREQMKRGSLR